MKPQDLLSKTAEYAKQRAAIEPKPARAYIEQIMKCPRKERDDRIKECPDDVQNTLTAHIRALEARAISMAEVISDITAATPEEARRLRSREVDRIQSPILRDEVRELICLIFKSRKGANRGNANGV